MNANEKNSGIIQLTIAMLLSGTIGYFVVESGQTPINVVLARCVIGSIFLIIYCLYAKLFNRSYLTSQNIGLIIIIGLSIVLNWVALFSSYKYASIGVTTTIYHVAPFIVFFGGAFLFKEGLSKSRMIWLFTAFAGVILIGDPENQNISVGKSYILGCGLALIAATFYAMATLASKFIKNVPPHVTALSQMLIGITVLSPFAEFSQYSGTLWQWNCLITLGVVHSAFMYILIYSSYKKLQTAAIAILSYIYPVVAVIVDYVAFDHVFSVLQIVGGVMILTAGLCGTLNLNPFMLKKQND